ncbi:MAG: helix-turn-helix domain-containing protein [Solirubrobacterales bacterium]
MAGSEGSTGADALGVRERRKLETRERLLKAAKEQFEKDGYDEVTVAQIAAAAGVTAKTLFQHFPSKEDLLMAELDDVHAEMIRALKGRERGVTPLQAVAAWLLDWEARRPPDGYDRFIRMVGTGPGVEAMRRRLYEEWEGAVVEVLADEANEARPNPRTRLVAAQLISMIRVLTSAEVTASLERYPPEERREAFMDWTREATEMLAKGLDAPG